jgi:hypothetical protein
MSACSSMLKLMIIMFQTDLIKGNNGIAIVTGEYIFVGPSVYYRYFCSIETKE